MNKVDGEIIAKTLKPQVKESIRRRRKEDHRHLKGARCFLLFRYSVPCVYEEVDVVNCFNKTGATTRNLPQKNKRQNKQNLHSAFKNKDELAKSISVKPKVTVRRLEYEEYKSIKC